jgi:hypothetical protein
VRDLRSLCGLERHGAGAAPSSLPSADAHYQLSKVGVDIYAGAESIGHSGRALVEEPGPDESHDAWQSDLRHALNIFPRAVSFRAVPRQVPNLPPWVTYCYRPASNVTNDIHIIHSSFGPQEVTCLLPCPSH